MSWLLPILIRVAATHAFSTRKHFKLTKSTGTLGANKDGRVLGVMGLRSGRLNVCSDSNTNSAMMASVPPLISQEPKLTLIQSFWITYQDMLKRWQYINRTQLFDSDWKVTQRWTSADIPWSIQYLETSFLVTMSEPALVVIVLCQVESSRAQTSSFTYLSIA